MNSIFTFSTKLTTETKEFVNFNKLIVVPDSVFSTSKYFYYITVPDDTRLDILSVTEYGNNMYTDLIFLINKMTSVFDLPRNVSYIETMIDSDYDTYILTLGNLSTIINPSNTTLLKKIRSDISNKYYTKNELYRNLRMVKPDYINEVIGVIKNANSI